MGNEPTFMFRSFVSRYSIQLNKGLADIFDFFGTKDVSLFCDLKRIGQKTYNWINVTKRCEDIPPDKDSYIQQNRKIFIGNMLCDEAGLKNGCYAVVFGNLREFYIFDEETFDMFLKDTRGEDAYHRYMEKRGRLIRRKPLIVQSF